MSGRTHAPTPGRSPDRGAPARHVAVVGGGLAGISAAIRLADAGCRVTLFEGRPRLGGVASSFHRDGLHADTGQHVLLRCYTAYRGLLARLGVADLAPLQPRMDIPVLLPGGVRTRLRRGRLGPAPLHLLPALTGYAGLSPRQRLRASVAAAALGRLDPSDPATDEQTFGHWLRRHGQDEQTLRRLWGLVTVAALNTGPDEASLALAATVFQQGLLSAVDAGDIGIPVAPLSRLHDDAAQRTMERLGVSIHLRSKVSAVAPTPEGFTVAVRSGADRRPEQVPVDGVVLAVPHPQAARIVPDAAGCDSGSWTGLGASPILNLHLRVDRRVLDVAAGEHLFGSFAAAPDSPVQWVFDRSLQAGVTDGQYLITSVSSAGEVASWPSERIQAQQVSALAELLPALRAARVLDAFVTREPAATFHQVAGTARLRPPARTALDGLVLAGAWTATGYPDTMEGAVRSGLAATDVLLGTRVSRSATQTSATGPHGIPGRPSRPRTADSPRSQPPLQEVTA
ncbi:MAG TPA: hydroxysqualene dehydroxylase HpnE [Segeticoccus sp.]|uniref:hydroxysqualene dehydroxylase HpnE n=1 Tax=Segeticoccus sp. TaxID=2706531 RepID=UPI002D7ED295|nr:hydroxysqualene dehydroxylase HpnE [Segeticoccus sp.]HET8600774.1 hydroxysqualene dehydroxylase HpnE [Segeticoccus sp.]